MTSDLQLSFPNQREPQKQGDFPLWERKLLFLPRICNIFLAGYIYPQAAWLQEPDAGLNGCAASAQHPGFLQTTGPPARCTEQVAGWREPRHQQQFEAHQKIVHGQQDQGKRLGKMYRLPGPAGTDIAQ